MQTAKGGSIRRPNTADTIMSWLTTNPEPGSLLVFANQPYVGYFEAVFNTFLLDSFSTEVIGGEASEGAPLALFLDNLARWLYQANLQNAQ